MESWVPDKRSRNRKKNNPRWKQFDPSALKLNTDVAVNSTGRAGLGFVVRGHGGAVELAGKCKVIAKGSSDLLEALAIRYGLQMARQYHLCIDTIECDNSGIVNNILGRSTATPYCDILVHEITQMMQVVGCGTVNHIPRLENQVAHEIARGPIFLCIKYTPKHIADVVKNDVIQ